MAAWYCPNCDDAYPNRDPFNHCPVCDTYTQNKPGIQQTVPTEEANRRAARKTNRVAFEKWLADNRWEEGTDTVQVKIYGERKQPSTREERLLATRVAYSLDSVPMVGGESGPGSGGPVGPVGELHVFFRG